MGADITHGTEITTLGMRTKGPALSALCTVALSLALVAVLAPSATASTAAPVVIVPEVSQEQVVAEAVESLGGTLRRAGKAGRPIEAVVGEHVVEQLRGMAAVQAVERHESVRMPSLGPDLLRITAICSDGKLAIFGVSNPFDVPAGLLSLEAVETGTMVPVGRVTAGETARVSVPIGTVRLRLGGMVVASLAPSTDACATGEASSESTPDTTADSSATDNPLAEVLQLTGARGLHHRGINGAGVDVAVIDTGVTAVAGLDQPDKLLQGPDLSFDGPAPDRRHIDGYGHGTYVTSILAGDDRGTTGFSGVAPGARVVAVKAGSSSGVVDVTQVIAAIDWVVSHRNDDGMNIRVLNLAFNTDGLQDYQIDPLAFAIENAWRKGIVVVVAAGNSGTHIPALANPARHPAVIAVGAVDTNDPADITDDTMAPFSGVGSPERLIDVAAPGTGVVGLAAPGSVVEKGFPDAKIGERFIRGSGTSQATAVVSGAAALLLQLHPEASPDQIKDLLVRTTRPMADPATGMAPGGMIDLKAAAAAPLDPAVQQSYAPASGLGTLDGARGSTRVVIGDTVIEGDVDVFGNAFVPARWARASTSEQAWQAGAWNGTPWIVEDEGPAANGASAAWSSAPWSSTTWSSTTWSSTTWSSTTWSSTTWSSAVWQ